VPNWALLAQFGTDSDANMMWGDCGTLRGESYSMLM
jgi:uncharacterized protein YwqG